MTEETKAAPVTKSKGKSPSMARYNSEQRWIRNAERRKKRHGHRQMKKLAKLEAFEKKHGWRPGTPKNRRNPNAGKQP